MALPGQDRFGYAVSELMQRMQIYGAYVLGVYEKLPIKFEEDTNTIGSAGEF